MGLGFAVNQELRDPVALATTVAMVLEHALHALAVLDGWERACTPADVSLSCWTQTWENTGCGFATTGELTGQAFTDALTVVVEVVDSGACAVYHAGRPAYTVRHPNPGFHADREARRLEGAASYRRHPTRYEAGEGDGAGAGEGEGAGEGKGGGGGGEQPHGT